jgi:putative nucleotidyltransferase with HDIG domain
MIKKVSTSQLRPGMYIHDLNCAWMDHPFATRRFKVENEKTIRRIVDNGIHEVYIDTRRGLDVAGAPSAQQAAEQREADLQKVAEAASRGKPKQSRISVSEERTKALAIQTEAREVATALMQDVRLGRQLEVSRVEPVVGAMVDSVFRNKDALISLGRIRDTDQYTFQHSVNLCVLMVAFAKGMGLDHDTIHKIGIGAMLHDIGKMKVPEEILNKPGKLTDEEFSVMRGHVTIGANVLAESPGIDPLSIAVAYEHHERWDGTGYPRKLKGEEISVYGQMSAIVDVYDAITSHRCYHSGMHPTDALGRMLEWSRHHFNPALTQQFIQCVGIYPVGTVVRLESGRLAVVMQANEKDMLKPLVRLIYDTRKRGFTAPRDLDLARASTQDRIVGHEDPEAFGIKVDVVMASKSV